MTLPFRPLGKKPPDERPTPLLPYTMCSTWSTVRAYPTALVLSAETIVLPEVVAPALEVPEARNQRVLLMEGYITNPRIARIIASMGDRFAKELPSNLGSLSDDIPPEGQRYEFSNKKSRDVLGIHYTDLETSVKDTVKSLVELGA